MLTDLNGNGVLSLVARFGSYRAGTLRTYTVAQAPAYAFRIDLRDASGRRNQQGRSMWARCVLDNSALGLKYVDGGGGYQSQSDYAVLFNSDWCPSITLTVATAQGVEQFGPLAPGTHVINMRR